MEAVVKILHSFAEADRAERAYYQSLTPQERLEVLIELNTRWLGVTMLKLPKDLRERIRLLISHSVHYLIEAGYPVP